MEISAYTSDLNQANASVKSVLAPQLFAGCVIVNRDTSIEAWRLNPNDESLMLITTYQVRGTIKEIKSFYSAAWNWELLIVLIKDIKLVILKFDNSINEFENIGMYNFETYKEISGKIVSMKESNNLLSVFTYKTKSIISLLVGDQWVAVIRTKQEFSSSLNEKWEPNSIGERIKNCFYPTQYFNLRDVDIKQVKDIKFTVNPNKAEEYIVAILYQTDVGNVIGCKSRPQNCILDVFEYSEKEEDQKSLRRLIENKQNEYEGLTSFSKIKKSRDYYMLMQPGITHNLNLKWRWKELDYYWNQLIIDSKYIIAVSNNLIYVWDFDLKYKICSMNSLGLITLHRNYIKEYIDFSSYDLNFANNFRYWFFYQTEQNVNDIFNKTSQIVWCFEKGNFVTIRIQTSSEIKVDIKSFRHESQETTIPSGIAIFPAYDSIYIVQSSRYSDLLINKLDYERTLKRPKLTEDDEEFIDLYLLPNPRLIVVDRLHVHGALEDWIVRIDDQDEIIPNLKISKAEESTSESKSLWKTNFDINETTLIYTSGYLYQSYIHVLKTHLNWTEKANITITNVDKIYWIQINSNETLKEFNAIVVSSEEEITQVYSYINNEFKEITSELDFIVDEFTLLWNSIKEEFILQITEQSLKLLTWDAKSSLWIVDGFIPIQTLKSVSASKDKHTIFAIGSENHILIFQVDDNKIIQNEDIQSMLTLNSEIIQKNYPILSFASITKNDNLNFDKEWTKQNLYFLSSSNSLFEIFNDTTRIFKLNENLKAIPSLLTDFQDTKIKGYRCFTDLTIPLVGIKDDNINKNLDHSVKEIHYHSFNGRTTYVFAILLSGLIQVFQEIEWLGPNKTVRFKKMLVPGLIGKRVNLEFQEYTLKESSSLK